MKVKCLEMMIGGIWKISSAGFRDVDNIQKNGSIIKSEIPINMVYITTFVIVRPILRLTAASFMAFSLYFTIEIFQLQQSNDKDEGKEDIRLRGCISKSEIFECLAIDSQQRCNCRIEWT